MSRKTTDAEKNYSSYELETLAVVQALKKFRVYLLGLQFKIVTDCKALTQTIYKTDIPPRIARWAMSLQDYTFTIEHRNGNRMAHVDGLSRFPVMVTSVSTNRVIQAQKEDTHIQEIIQAIKKKPSSEYSLTNNVLYRFVDGRYLLVVPEVLATGIIRQVHESNGHFKSDKIETILKTQYDIPKLQEKLKFVVHTCVPCLISNKKRGKIEGLLMPIPKDDQPLQTIHADHLGPMTTTDKKYQYIFAIIDGFTKFGWLYPTKTTSSREVIEKMNMHRQIFGNPIRLITDKATAFTSHDFQDYCDENKIQHKTITTGVPRGNGQIERLNQSIISVLTKLCVSEPRKWYRHVPEIQMVLNSTFQRAINTSPFEALFGTSMRKESSLAILDMLEEDLRETFNRQQIRENAKLQILKIQQENMATYNKKAKPAKIYAIGDSVYIKRTQFGTGLKIRGNFLGPYVIRKNLGNNRYEVEKITDGEGPIKTTTSADNIKFFKSALAETANV